MLIRLKLREVAGQQILATVTVKQEGQDDQEFEGHLAPIPIDLTTAFDQWKSAYSSFHNDVRLRLTPISAPTHSSQQTLSDCVHGLKAILNDWIDRGDGDWQRLQQDLAVLAQQNTGETRILLDVKDSLLRRLPWQEWSFLRDRFPQAEIAIRASSKAQAVQAAAGIVRILVVVGDCQGIEPGVQQDIATLNQLETHGAEVRILEQPTSHQLLEQLRHQSYEIFVFTGHSGSDSQGQIGWIDLSPHDRLMLDSLENALAVAIRRRLQLCIFNSCDGLGLAMQLSKLKLPVSIVMREPVPDEVAVTFLRVFFTQFSTGKSLFSAMCEAREQLEGFTQYPGIVWLPTICLGSSVEPPTWQTFQHGSILRLSSQENSSPDARLPAASAPPRSNTKLSDAKPSNAKLSNAKPQWWWAATAVGVVGVIALGALLAKSIVSPGNDRPVPAAVQPSASPSPQQTVAFPTERAWKYGGSNSAMPLQAKTQRWLSQTQPNVQLVFKLLSGSAEGLQQLKQGDLDFALSSEPLTRSDEAAGLEAIPVAMDGIAIVVHPNLSKISHLSLDQLKQIYTSKITNWQRLGGPDLAIVAISRGDKSGTTRFFRKEVLEGAAFGKTVQILPSITSDLGKVATTPGSIYFGTATQLVGQCMVKPLPLMSQGQIVPPYQGTLVPRDRNCPNLPKNQPNVAAIQTRTYPLTRSLFVVTKRNTGASEQAGKAYAAVLLTPQGQNIVQAVGFVAMPKQ